MTALSKYRILAACLISSISLAIHAQQVSVLTDAPVTTAASVADAVPGPVSVPVTVTGFNNIAAISLSLDYNYSTAHFTGGTSNPLLPNFPVGEIDLGTGYHRITMGWYGSAASLADGSAIMTLHFNYIGGITSLAWYDNGPSCEYAGSDLQPLNDTPTGSFYINGNICGAIGDPGQIIGQDTLCQGTAGVNYSVETVENATSYTWTVPEGAVIVNGENTNIITVDYGANAISGNVSVYGTNACGTGPSSILPVTINTLPVADAGDDFTINYGTSTTLHAAQGGSGTFSYHWSPEELLVDPDMQDPQTVILTATTLFNLLVTNTETLCQQSDQVIVTITGGPLSVNPLAEPGTICSDDSSRLYSNAGGGSGNYTYQWTANPPGSPPWSSTLPNPVVSPGIPTLYHLEVDDGFTSTNGNTQLLVFENPGATISGGDTLCGDGETTILRVDLTGSPPWSYTYTFGNTSVFITGQQESPDFTIASEPGDYYISAVEDAHCPGQSFGTAIVRKYPVPATPEITIYGYELISSSCCGNQWYKNDNPEPGATGQTYQVTESGNYFTVVTLNNCSSNPSESVDMIVGIQEKNPSDFVFYPNPASDHITIRTSKPYIKNLSVSILNMDGSVIYNSYPGDYNPSLNIDTGFLPEGLYFIRVNDDESVFLQKLMIINN